MPAVKIRVPGKTEDKPKPAAKPASTRKRSAARKGTTPAAKRGTPQKRTTTRPAKSTDNGAPVRRASKGIDARTEARLLKLVEKAGERRTKAEAEHKEAIDALHATALEALDGGVSMAKVADSSGISRQWLYKMGDFKGRESVSAGGSNGKASAPKPATRPARPARSKPAATRSTRRTASTRSAPKSTGHTRIRTRA